MATRQTVTSNFIWRFLERTGAQGVTFIVSLVLARILEPSVYGSVALVTVLISILSVFIDCGFGEALIQKKDADDLDFSSVFYFNVTICIILFSLLFIFAPLVTKFYKMPKLVPVIRVLGITIIISGVKNIQIAYVSKNLIFKKFFFATLGGTIGASVVGILLALRGFGVWALVVQSLFNNVVDTIILWITVKWRPKWMFSWKRLKGLFNYGWKLLVSGLIDTLYGKLRQLIIGKMYTTSDLAFYTKGDSIPSVFVSNINSSINSVLMPCMAEEQDNVERIKEMTRKSIGVCSYLIMPMMMGLAVCTEPLVRLVLTDKWLPVVPYLRIFCFTYAFYPIHVSNLNALKAMGRSDLFLKLEIIKKIVGLVALLSTMWFGVMIMAYSLLLTSILSQIINSWPNRKLLKYSYLEQLKDILPQIGITILMGIIVFAENFIPINDIIKLVIQIPTGICIYLGFSKLFKIESYSYIVDMMKKRVNERKDGNK